MSCSPAVLLLLIYWFFFKFSPLLYVPHEICNGDRLDLNIELRLRQEREEVAHLRDGPLFESVSRGPIMGVFSPLLRQLEKSLALLESLPKQVSLDSDD